MKFLPFRLLLITALAMANKAHAQADTILASKPDLIISGFVDAFYVYDFNKPSGNERQRFLFNHNRHNEFNINLALLKAELTHYRYRAKIALQAGTYPNDNYAGEDATLKNIFQASAGLAIDRKARWWIDAGIMPSHIGFESALSIENPTLTRSLLAENSPYFLTGARLTYTPSNRWIFTLWTSNGWQRIKRLEGNSIPGIGTGLTYTNSKGATLNWSTFVCSEYPDNTRRYRYFNNFYAKIPLGKATKIIAGFDVGAQQSMQGGDSYDVWFSPVLILQHMISSEWSTALRAEHYQDNSNVIIAAAETPGFETLAFSINVDYSPLPNLACRVEARQLLSTNDYLAYSNGFRDSDFFVSSSIAVKF